MSKIMKNYFYNMSYQLLILLLPLITTPYVSRVLGAEGVGTYSYTYSITEMFIIFGCVGLNVYGFREVAYYQKDKYQRSKVFYELLILRSLFLLASLFVFYITTVVPNPSTSFIYLLQAINIVAAFFDISYLFQGMEEFKKTVIRNFFIKIAGTVCIFLFVKQADDLLLYIAILAMATFLGNLSLWLYLPKYIEKVSFRNLLFKKHIKPTLALFLPQIATSIYTIMDKTMIGLLTQNNAEVGYYQQGQKIVKIALTIVTTLGTTLMPRIASLYAEGNNELIKKYIYDSFRFAIALSMPIMFGLMAISANMVPWFFGDGFEKVIPNMMVIAPITLLIAISNVLGAQFLLPTKRQFSYSFSLIASATVNFILNLILIPSFMSIGAAISTVIAEFSLCVIQFYFVRDIFSIKEVLHLSKIYFISAILMFGGVYAICTIWNSSILVTAIGCFIGVVIYFVFVIVIFKDSFIRGHVLNMIHKFKKR